MMTAKEIRQEFLDYFENKGHQFVPSAPITVKDDPTLMFINAGMNQFKDLFLGNAAVKHARICNSQKCLRVSGKHNDLEEVGVDTYHHTLFEMLGNWSFGDYFKKDAIAWAWEFLTEVCKINPDSLYVTVFEGAKEDDLSLDQDAYDFWKQHIAEDRILMGSKADNFWEMGKIGPCGPCSEIHVDIRSDEEKALKSGAELVNMDHPQVVEVWNLVFMEYNRLASGDLEKLPAQHVDTGMGFERLAMVIQGKQSNYDTDVFMPIIRKIVDLTGKKYGQNEETDIAIRVVADHVRAVSFAIADGQLPSNTGAGYVIRRILRRGIRYGYSKLDKNEAFIYKLVDVLAAEMGEFFPEIISQKELIQKVIKEEENSFLHTLAKGIERYKGHAKGLSGKVIDGKFAFELFDTYGFPIDLSELLARENGLTINMDEFRSELQKQKERSRAATVIDAGDWIVLNEGEGTFVGYDQLETETRVLRYREVKAKDKSWVQVELGETPFYPEGGGQVGDVGVLVFDEEKLSVADTKKENGVILHYLQKMPADVNASVKAVVSGDKRKASAANHTATHLMHHALRKVLGTHVEQKGSLVNPKNLRFDFSHFQKVSKEELEKISEIVNQGILENHALKENRSANIEQAKSQGAMALFGEKYGDKVRVIQFGESVELCGGIHVNSSAQIGKFIITSEAAVASGVRRIEAITLEKANDFINKEFDLLAEVRDLLKNPKDLKKQIQGLLADNNSLQKQVEKFQKEQSKGLKSELLKEVENINGINFLAKKVAIDSAEGIKDLAFQMKAEVENLFLVLGAEIKGKPNLTVVISDKLSQEKDLNAGKIIRELAKEIQGGGGGQAFYATAGGNKVEGIESALEKARGLI
jgi:alanyl-tRNA synthetase